MKILCLQLARYGDIYQTWPVLNALRRAHPVSTIHFLVREKFSDAGIGLDSSIRVMSLPTKSILAPVFSDDIKGSQKNMNMFVDALKQNKYDKIINLSFSPFSSYLVELIATEETTTMGYTRYSDGHLCLPDDASSYFYSQVGVDRSNRIHLTDIFGLIAGVELTRDDFSVTYENIASNDFVSTNNPYVVVHLGASNKSKTCKPEQWASVVDKILQQYSGSVVLIGTEAEGQNHPALSQMNRVINLCGQTKIGDVFHVLRKADALVGGDSVLLHMASLTGTPTLNLSFSCVNFWETGPRAPLSRILLYADHNVVNAEQVAVETLKLINHQPAGDSVIEKINEAGLLYGGGSIAATTFEWELTKSLYMNSPFPKSDDITIDLGLKQLKEVAVTALEQMNRLQNESTRSVALQLLDQTDLLIQRISNLVPEISPLIRWFQTEKTRIPPSNLSTVTARTKELYEKLVDICQLYTINGSFEETMPREDLNWKS